MKFKEIEEILDGKAFLEYNSKLYKYQSAAIDCVKPRSEYFFRNIDDENDALVLTRTHLREDEELHICY